jgi:hypothetical protein
LPAVVVLTALVLVSTLSLVVLLAVF